MLSSIIAGDRAWRISVCNSCPFSSQNKKTCLKCGCNVKAKASLALAKCPLGKWQHEEHKEDELKVTNTESTRPENHDCSDTGMEE